MNYWVINLLVKMINKEKVSVDFTSTFECVNIFVASGIGGLWKGGEGRETGVYAPQPKLTSPLLPNFSPVYFCSYGR